MRIFLLLLLGALGLAGATPASERQRVQVAVAANFAAPMKRLVADFERSGPYTVQLSHGATGKITAQIRAGAPFDVLLAADSASVQLLAREQRVLGNSVFTYATGRLVLWSAQPGLVDAQAQVLRSPRFQHLALAAPALSPYGAAAMQTLQALGVADALKPRLVLGESIGQAYSFVASGNAELGFVALSQVWDQVEVRRGSHWLVPQALHAPLAQQAALLVRGQHNPAAQALLRYLHSDAAKAVIRSFGYQTP